MLTRFNERGLSFQLYFLVCIVSYISIIIYFYTVVETLIYLSSKIMGLIFHHQLYN